jgi:hypothetical protein
MKKPSHFRPLAPKELTQVVGGNNGVAITLGPKGRN